MAFSPVITQGWLVRGGGENTRCSYTCIMDPLVLEIAQKIMKSVNNFTLQGCVRPNSLVAFVQQPAETTEYKPGIYGCLTCLRKQPQKKQTGKVLPTVHAHMDCLIMCL